MPNDIEGSYTISKPVTEKNIVNNILEKNLKV